MLQSGLSLTDGLLNTCCLNTPSGMNVHYLKTVLSRNWVKENNKNQKYISIFIYN